MTTASEQHDRAVQQLDAALVEQARLGECLDAAAGTSIESQAYARLRAAGDRVAAREAWLHWVDDQGYRGLNAGPFELLAESRPPAFLEGTVEIMKSTSMSGPEPPRSSSQDTAESPAGVADRPLWSYDERDAAADERDLAAQRRDRAADERDQVAERRDRGDRRSSRPDSTQAADDRRRAAHDRRRAAHDRRRAGNDRREAGRDRHQAGLDTMTGALRRERGVIDLRREVDRARRSDGALTLAFVDVDGLKTINDAHGHAAGDRALRVVAAALLRGLRSYDLVVRHGGDEFLCGLPGTDLAAAQHRFGAVARTLSEQNPGTSGSIGLAGLATQDTLEALIAGADRALYAARRNSR